MIRARRDRYELRWMFRASGRLLRLIGRLGARARYSGHRRSRCDRGPAELGDAEGSPIFGPGLIRAYYLESAVARHPRVVLDPEIAQRIGLPAWIDDPVADAEEFERHVLELGQYCSRDTDGAIFVDYLHAVCTLGDDGTEEAIGEVELFKRKAPSVYREGASGQ